MMALIKELDLGKQRQEEAFGFHKLASAETAKCTDPKLTPLQTAYTTALAEFDQALKTGGASPLSQQIAEQDVRCDNAYIGLAGQIRNNLHHFDPARAATAKEADLILRKYGNPCSLPYVEESGVLHNLIQDLEDFDAPSENERPEEVSLSDSSDSPLATIGAREWLDHLKAMNDQFLLLFAQRNTAQADVVSGASKATRTAVDNAYRSVVKRINALAEVNGDESYIAVINALNNLIDRQKSVMAARKTINAKKNKGEGNERPEEV